MARLPVLDLSRHAREAAIPYAAIRRLEPGRLWKAGSLLSWAMTEQGVTDIPQHESSFSRRIAPEFLIERHPRKNRGRRECRVLAATHGPPAKSKQAAVTTGPAESSGIPCTMVLTLIARSPWEPGFVAPIAREIITRELGLSVGRPGPHALASAPRSFVRAPSARCDPTRPPHPALHVRDDRDPPLMMSAGRRGSYF